MLLEVVVSSLIAGYKVSKSAACLPYMLSNSSLVSLKRKLVRSRWCQWSV